MNLFVRYWTAQPHFLVVPVLWLTLTVSVKADDGEVDFNSQIRPLLSNNCLTCHGPDEEERVAGLRLDTEAGSRHDLGGSAAIVPGIQLPAR